MWSISLKCCVRLANGQVYYHLNGKTNVDDIIPKKKLILVIYHVSWWLSAFHALIYTFFLLENILYSTPFFISPCVCCFCYVWLSSKVSIMNNFVVSAAVAVAVIGLCRRCRLLMANVWERKTIHQRMGFIPFFHSSFFIFYSFFQLSSNTNEPLNLYFGENNRRK